MAPKHSSSCSPPSKLPACLMRATFPGHEPSASWDVQRPSGEGRLFPGAGHASPGPEPHTLRKEGMAGVAEGPAGAAPGLAVLYGFLFLCDSTAHSYRDWSHGARRGRPAEGSNTEQGDPRRAGTVAQPSPSTGCWPGQKIPPLLLSSPLASFPPGVTGGGTEGCWTPSLL